LMRFDL